MKITNVLNLANAKALLTRAAMVGLVAGAAFMATPAKANAQVALGLRIGHARVGVYAPGPAYYNPAPVYYNPGPVYVAPAYGYAYGYRPDYNRYRDHRDFDHDRRDGYRDRR
jgi:hypothetical protein